jgi:hypothetical protein
MLKKFLLAASVVAGLSLGQFAQAKEAPKPIEVHVCPISQEAVEGKGAGSEVVGKYKVFFCCGGCQGELDKLSAQEKDKKIQAALKIQEDAKKKKG